MHLYRNVLRMLQERTVRGNPAVALVVTFFSALLLGALVGGVLICFVFHFRDQAARKRALGPGKPISGANPAAVQNHHVSLPLLFERFSV